MGIGIFLFLIVVCHIFKIFFVTMSVLFFNNRSPFLTDAGALLAFGWGLYGQVIILKLILSDILDMGILGCETVMCFFLGCC